MKYGFGTSNIRKHIKMHGYGVEQIAQFQVQPFKVTAAASAISGASSDFQPNMQENQFSYLEQVFLQSAYFQNL